MQSTAMGKELTPKPKDRLGRCARQVRRPCGLWGAVGPERGSLSRSMSWEGRREVSSIGIKRYHFAPEGKTLLNRPKPFLHVHLRREVDSKWGGGALRGPRRGD